MGLGVVALVEAVPECSVLECGGVSGECAKVEVDAIFAKDAFSGK